MALFAPVFQQYFDNNGNPLSGGQLFTYEANTTTPKITYTSEDESTANTNPIILDAGGRADVWLESGSYTFVLRDSAGVLIDQIDDITGAAANVFGSSVVDVATNTNITSVFRNNVIRTTATPITLTLLPASTAGEGFLFSVKNTSAGNNTIDPDGAELIDGQATLTIEPDQSVLIVCDGTGWTSLFLAEDILDKNNIFTGNNTFQGTVDVTNVDGETSTGIVLRNDASTAVLTLGSGTTTDATFSGQVDMSSNKIVNVTDPTANQDAATKNYVDTQIVFATKFTSSPITPATGAQQYSVAHGLGGRPELARAYIRCTTSDRGYDVGDDVILSSYFDSGNSGNNLWTDTTTVGFVTTGGIFVTSKTGGSNGEIDYNDWDLYLEAYI